MPTILQWQRRLAVSAGLAALLAAASWLLGARTYALAVTLQKAIGAFGLDVVWRQHVLVWWLAAVPAIAALLVRERWPVVAFAAAAGSAVVHQLDPNLGRLPMDLAVAVTLYTMASLALSRVVGLLGLLAALAMLYLACLATALGLGAAPIVPEPPSDRPLLDALSAAAVPGLLLGIAWTLGDNARTRRQHVATLQERAADLRRERDQRATLAVAAERARITRELHDVVAHGVSVMVIQAQVASAGVESDEAREALTHVITTGRASLTEMRRVLGVLRTEGELAPQPGMAALPALVDEVRGSGTPVRLHVEGDPVPLPAAIDLSAYRIIQEALTNTRKHAGPGAGATVLVHFAPERLEIEVSDDGSAALPLGDGHGLRGIGERVTALGGSMTAGPCDGGFAVRAMLPLPDPS